MRNNFAGLYRAHRRAGLRWNDHRCNGTTLKGGRCMLPGVRKENGYDFCRFHYFTDLFKMDR